MERKRSNTAAVDGQVIKGSCDGMHDVALKISNTDLSTKELLKEISILRNCRNSNIVQVQMYLYCAHADVGCLYMKIKLERLVLCCKRVALWHPKPPPFTLCLKPMLVNWLQSWDVGQERQQ